MTPTIETKKLVKHYGDVKAVDDLSLCVARGEIYAFLGLNGAGKTTTIRMLLGMVKPTAGEAQVLGTPVRRGEKLVETWQSVGYMVERPQAYPELTVRENLDAMRRLRPGTAPEAVNHVIDQLHLTPYAGRRTSTLSHGNAQRLGLAKALLHRPELLILDEPANGLDPAGIVEIRNLLRELAEEEGVTVFMSSHILVEVARLADRIGIIHEGRLLQELDIDALERRRRRWLRINARDPQAARAVLSSAGYTVNAPSTPSTGSGGGELFKPPASSPSTSSGGMVGELVEPQAGSPSTGSGGGEQSGVIDLLEERAIERPDDVATLLVNAGHAPTMLNVEHEDLEHYFLRLVGMEETTGK